MPFSKGNQLGHGRPKGSVNKKSLWLLESLTEHGYDYEKMLTKFLDKAAKGDRHALDMAHLLVKMVPYLANMPKSDAGVAQIETLVINRYELNDRRLTPEVGPSVVTKQDVGTVDTTTVPDDQPPLTLP